MSHGYVIAVIGATGMVGKEIAAALVERAEFSLRDIRLFSSTKNDGETIYLNNMRHIVHALPKDPLSLAQFDNVDVVILATPSELSKRLAPIFLDEGIIVVDIGGWVYSGAPKSIAGLYLDEEFFAEERYISIPMSTTTIVARVVAQLQELGVMGLRAHVLLGASHKGKEGVEELSSQVSAVFHYRDAPQVIFSEGLAFDLAPALSSAQEESTHIQLQLAHALNMGVGQVDISTCFVPIFSGMGISLQVLLQNIDLEEIEQAFQGSLFGWAHQPSGPKKMMGSSVIQLGKARVDALGQGVHLWISADGIQAGVVENTLAVLTHFIDKE